ncbi:hypothetical protein R3P38DRAFT_2591652 [Favolaschia claudopus]|uniref:DUF6589 domain-containing protein n=1 Tax=Favolaschia claudopus TaxID=2862362 RepID=A0AAV9Z084_9AGAR
MEEDHDAATTVGATSSPPDRHFRNIDLPDDVLSHDFGASDDDENYAANSRAPKLDDAQKTIQVLRFINQFSRFSLRLFLEQLFTSENSEIKNRRGTYLGQNGYSHILKVMFTNNPLDDPAVVEWIMEKSTDLCVKEASRLTDTARKGAFSEDALSLRLASHSVKIQHLRSFSVSHLSMIYERAAPHLQTILRAVIGKQSPDSDSIPERQQRDPDKVRTMITSMLLNCRSRETNLHQAMNCLLFWDGRVSKRLVQTMNRYALCTSYNYQLNAIASISKDATRLASIIANDPTRMCLLPYDNFNWVEKAWEKSATHANVSHDQVSAILVVLDLPPDSGPTDAARLSHVLTFSQTSGTRHHLDPAISLEQILPNSEDQHWFAKHAEIHVSHILGEEVETLALHRNLLGPFHELNPLPVKKSEEYFLPTYDQEQGSTRGNMLVIEHYFRDILKMPAAFFEEHNSFLLGDRLTTARDRAAQDQRAIDRSENRFDHLESFSVISGLMHVCMNQIQNMARNTFGTAGGKDSVSLASLLERLPSNRNLNVKKIDFYAWLRFFDVVLRAFVLRAAMVILNVDDPSDFRKSKLTADAFRSLCTQVVTQFLLPSVDRLEAEDRKKLLGSTESGNAVLMMHDLMTMMEMRDAIKYGHPDRVERMLKYWTPMFYAGGSYNYSNELMELLHNLIHDWPPETAHVLRGGMIMNNQGKRNTFKETDIRVEQFNKSIKSHAHGSNARPGLLEKITPAIGHIQELTEKVYDELGVFDQDQRHRDVSQHKDVVLLLEHFSRANIFNFAKDKRSNHLVVDLFRTGLHRLAGPKGGHAKHLQRHSLRSRNRHYNELPPGYHEKDFAPTSTTEVDSEEEDTFEKELEQDNARATAFTSGAIGRTDARIY